MYLQTHANNILDITNKNVIELMNKSLEITIIKRKLKYQSHITPNEKRYLIIQGKVDEKT